MIKRKHLEKQDIDDIKLICEELIDFCNDESMSQEQKVYEIIEAAKAILEISHEPQGGIERIL